MATPPPDQSRLLAELLGDSKNRSWSMEMAERAKTYRLPSFEVPRWAFPEPSLEQAARGGAGGIKLYCPRCGYWIGTTTDDAKAERGSYLCEVCGQDGRPALEPPQPRGGTEPDPAGEAEAKDPEPDPSLPPPPPPREQGVRRRILPRREGD